MDFQLITIIFFVVWAFALAIGIDAFDVRTSTAYKIHVVVYLLLLGAYIPTKGWEDDKYLVKARADVRILVSAQPSHTQLEGSIHGAFSVIVGVINESRVYLLREEISEGLYKDFEVREEVYIRENPELSDRGKFVKYYNCYNHNVYLDLYGWQPIKFAPEYKCYYKRQEIEVPKGAVIKELNI